MTLLKTFATMALMASALLMLLPEGSLRRTAALAMGLLLTLCWAEGLTGLLSLPEGDALPDTPLSVTGMSVRTAEEDAADDLVRRLTPEVTQTP